MENSHCTQEVDVLTLSVATTSNATAQDSGNQISNSNKQQVDANDGHRSTVDALIEEMAREGVKKDVLLNFSSNLSGLEYDVTSQNNEIILSKKYLFADVDSDLSVL